MRTISAALAVLLLALAGCGGSDDDALTVSAAASLKKALTQYGGEFEDAKARFSFAGSDELAAQLRVLGSDRLVLAWIPPPTSSLEADRAVERIGAAARRTTAAGLRFGFHNHDGELRILEDGSTMLDRLLALDDQPLFLEIDLGWAWYAGVEPEPESELEPPPPHAATSAATATIISAGVTRFFVIRPPQRRCRLDWVGKDRV